MLYIVTTLFLDLFSLRARARARVCVCVCVCTPIGLLRRLYEFTRLPVVPIYGVWPVKLRLVY